MLGDNVDLSAGERHGPAEFLNTLIQLALRWPSLMDCFPVIAVVAFATVSALCHAWFLPSFTEDYPHSRLPQIADAAALVASVSIVYIRATRVVASRAGLGQALPYGLKSDKPVEGSCNGGAGGTIPPPVWTHCSRCDLWRPPLSHHCSVCGVCITQFDHHCVWLSTCIGAHNRLVFTLLLLSAAVASGATVLGLRQLHLSRHSTRFSLCLFLYCTSIGVALALYACYNTLMVASGMNQYQLLQWMRQRHKERSVRERDMRV
jgi:cytochrome bd-type quinol oxidase subunit 2